MFPTNSERLIGVSDAFSAFIYGYPSSCPRAHCTASKSVPTLRYTFAFMLLYVHGGEMAETVRKRPERPWTATRTMEVLRRCPLAIAQRLVHCAIAVSTAVLDRVTKTMSIARLLTNNLDNSKQKMSNLLSPAQPPYS